MNRSSRPPFPSTNHGNRRAPRSRGLILFRPLPALFLLWGTMAGGASADTLYWTGATDGAIDTIANWATDLAGTTPATSFGTTPSLVFSSENMISDGASLLGGNWAVQSLAFNNAPLYSTEWLLETVGSLNTSLTVGSGGITTTNPAGPITIGSLNEGYKIDFLLGSSQTWSNSSGGVMTIINGVATGGNQLTVTGTSNTLISGVVSGTGGIVKSGTGTLTLGGANTFEGDIILNGGILAMQAGSIHALNSTAGKESSVTFGSGSTGILRLNNTVTLASLDSNPAVLGAPIVGNYTGVAKILTVGNSENKDSAYGGVIVNGGSAALSLTKAGTGTMTLSGVNTYSGTTTVSAGVLELSGAGSILPTAITGSKNIQIGGGTLLINAAGAGNAIGDALPITLNPISGAVGKLALQGTVTETLGAVTLSGAGTRVIDFGATSGVLRLNSLAGATSGMSLQVWNWSGNRGVGGGTDQLIINNGLSGANIDISNIKFYSDSGTTELSQVAWVWGGTTGELAPIPEASSLMALLALLAPLGWKERKQWMRCRLAR